jgi:serpin B
MESAFTSKANFSGISRQPLQISSVLQKTFLEVDEEGTEAAAVTGITVTATAVSVNNPPPFEMIVDRPYLFLIEDSRSSSILFMGVISDPSLAQGL